MDRKLLPYEHQLIEALGVSKEEYLEFVAIQQEYQDPKAGTELDIRNDAGTVAIVLTVVGILFQVGAALLTPKPKTPDIEAARRTAVWPDATLEQLQSKEALTARLDGLLAEFREVVESAGFVW